MGAQERTQGGVRQRHLPAGARNMTDKLTIGGEGKEWVMFSRTPPGGHPVFIRSRTGQPDVHTFAEKNFFARLRCTLPPEGLTEAGVPKAAGGVGGVGGGVLPPPA